MQYRQLDIQLLAVFEALLTEQNVTRAAERVNLSQSATSKALGRLREMFGDPLFMRSPRGVTPTHRAMELAPRIRHMLEAARALLDTQGEFDALSATTVFNVAASDYISFVLLPVLIPFLETMAPGTRLAVHDLNQLTPEEMLLSGRVDLALASVARVSRPLHRQEVFHDEYVCVGRSGQGGRTMELPDFVNARQLVIPRQNGGGMAVVDDALAQLSLSREVVASVPHFMSIPGVLSSTDLVATVPSRVGTFFAGKFDLKVYPHPLSLPRFAISQVWHHRTDTSASHRWLRENVARVCATL